MKFFDDKKTAGHAWALISWEEMLEILKKNNINDDYLPPQELFDDTGNAADEEGERAEGQGDDDDEEIMSETNTDNNQPQNGEASSVTS